jgi:apolipoprotein N-acyltransferase
MTLPFCKFKSGDFNISILIKGFITATFLSGFIYFEHFNLTNLFINTLFAILGIILVVFIDKKSLFVSGFFVGILWFYWVSFSFVYYQLPYLVPIIILVFAFVYGFLFYLTAIINHFLPRLILFFLLGFVEPFGFNWFKPELIFLNTYFNTYESKIKEPNIKTYMPQYNTPQEYKWDKNNLTFIVKENFNQIDYAIKNNYELIIFPETVFPLALNTFSSHMDILKEKSKYIDIVAGSITLKDNQFLNSTYHFSKGEYTIAHKVVLVPFGESVPLPEFMVDFVNDTFFNGASDYQKSANPTTFKIKNIKFRNAICYEATSDEIYKNLDTNYIIAISNNAWFTPSIEPTLQALLLKYYAKKYELFIYHSSNKSKNMVIK